MAHRPEHAPEAPIYSEIDEEILRLRNSLPRNEAGPSRRVTFGDQRENVLIRELLHEIRELRMQLIGPPVNEHANRDSGRRETFGQSSHPLDLNTEERTKTCVINRDLHSAS